MEGNIPLKMNFVKIERGIQSKDELLHKLASYAAQSEALKKFKEKKLFELLKQREELGSTGFGEGISIPHCSIEGIEEFVVGLMLLPEGVDFDAIDGNPVSIAFLIIGPKEQRNRHIKILSAISKMLKTPGVSEKLLSFSREEEAGEYLRNNLTIREDKPDSEGYSLISVYVQKEEAFDETLELLSSEVEGSLTVIETQNAGSYLNRLPLFSSYWTEGNASFNRLIQAIVPRSKSNDLIRRINLIEDTFSDNPGIMVTVQELQHASGSIDF